MTRVGVLPYLWQDDELCIVIVSSRDGDRWVLPKGRPKSGMSRRALARLEAWEEAGISGVFEPDSPIDVTIRRNARRQALRLYPMRVEDIAERWPERRHRKRKVVTAVQAQAQLTDRGMADAVRSLLERFRAAAPASATNGLDRAPVA